MEVLRSGRQVETDEKRGIWDGRKQSGGEAIRNGERERSKG